MVTKDVTHAYALPITHKTAEEVEGGTWAPLNIIDQWSIHEKGDRIKKKRLTYDQSFPGIASELSINDQVKTNTIEPLIYGFMFLQVIHVIHAMQ